MAITGLARAKLKPNNHNPGDADGREPTGGGLCWRLSYCTTSNLTGSVPDPTIPSARAAE
jgi:hypothetical protein